MNMENVAKKLSTLVAALLLFPITNASADNLYSALPPRVTLSGTTGNNSFGEGDAMIPLVGNCNQLFYTDVGSKYGENDAWFGSIGLGDRNIVNNNTILGAYVFGDYNKTTNANYFPVVNPGVELMTNAWDAHWNGYFPVGEQSKLVALYTGQQLGILNTELFTGHSEYSNLFDLRENVGPGTDFEVGRTFYPLNRTRFFAGSYFFNPDHMSGIHGIEGGFQIPVYHQTVFAEFRDSYDNVYRNTATVSFRINFGGMNKTCAPDIHDRMLDVIPRHLANLYNGNGIPSPTKIMITGRYSLVRDNIWFFLPTNGAPSTINGFQDGTYENPAHGLSQAQINTINALAPNANFYINSGIYNNPAVGSGYSFFNGQNVFGRMNYFQQLADANNLPVINDTLLLNGNNNINNIAVNGNSIQTIIAGGGTVTVQLGVLVLPQATGTININNSQINVASSQNGIAAVASASLGGTLNINNSQLNVTATNVLDPSAVAVGIGNISDMPLTVNNSSIIVNSINNNAVTIGIANNQAGIIDFNHSSLTLNVVNGNFAVGILGNPSSTTPGILNIMQSTLTLNGDNVQALLGVLNQGSICNIDQSTINTTLSNSVGAGSAALGVQNAIDGTLNITNSVINSTLNNSPSVSVGGIASTNFATANVTNTTINVVSNNNPGSGAVGVSASDNAITNVNGSRINLSGNAGTLIGLLNANPGVATINFVNTIIGINTGGTASGVPTVGLIPANDQGGNTCVVDGVAQPCI